MKIQSTKNIKKDEKIHIGLYGLSGSGKTKMIETLQGRTLVLNSDKGLLTLKGSENIDFISINTFAETIEAMKYIQTAACNYDNIVVDSLSVIGDQLYEYLEGKGLKGFDIWRDYKKYIKSIVSTLRDSTKFNSVTIFEMVRKENESGLIINAPRLDGSLSSQVDYFFDCFLATKVKHSKDGAVYSLQTKPGDGYNCKIRGGDNIPANLDQNLSNLFKMIREG